jgi:hypothetical protein
MTLSFRSFTAHHRFDARRIPTIAVAATLLVVMSALVAPGAEAELIDLAELTTSGDTLHRTHGSVGSGAAGLPIAGGFDCDGDGANDLSFASMRASPFGRNNAGELYLVFGDGTISGTLDTAVDEPRILVITGSHARENAGSEIWMGEVTGDGVGDLLIARQNFNGPSARNGAGALSILVGGPELASYAATLQPLDLATPPKGVTITTLVGPAVGGRLGIWVRAGDVDGDGVDDLVIGADQEGSAHQGATYVVRGGAHLASGGTIDLADFGSTAIEGHLARITAPDPGSNEYHLGATVQIGDLDGNGRGEVLTAATLNRAGAGLQSDAGGSHGSGGAGQGTLYIVWDDNFGPDPWPPGYTFDVDDAPGTWSAINGNARSRNFGEEILADLDFDADGDLDLFVGDITGDASPDGNRRFSGHGYVFYDSADLAGRDIDLDARPVDLVTTLILGARTGDLAADTAAAGDFDGDGIDDLAIASPHFDPLNRGSAGAFHVLHGQQGMWPETVDLASLPDAALVRVTEVYGALGSTPGENGDTLGYSAASGFIDDDNRRDLISNEMVGNGFGGTPPDVGNLIVLSGAEFVPEPGTSVLAATATLVLAGLRRAKRGIGPAGQ